MFLRMTTIRSFHSTTATFRLVGRWLPLRYSDNSHHSHYHHRHRSSKNRAFHKSTAIGLNRFLFDPCEIDLPLPSPTTTTTTTTTASTITTMASDDSTTTEKIRMEEEDNTRNEGGYGSQSSKSEQPTVTLSKNDYRTIHAAKILGLLNGDTLRAGIVQDRNTQPNGGSAPLSSNVDTNAIKQQQPQRISNHYQSLAGLVTDRASIEWLPEGKIKKAQPTKNGEPPGSIRITLHSLISPEQLEQHGSNDTNTTTTNTPSTSTKSNTTPKPPRVSLILAIPRPLGLSRLLPMISQLGVDHLVLTAARKVPKDYFGSHLVREPQEVRRLLIEGLCQAGDVKIPKVTIVRRLKVFLEDDLEDVFPMDGAAEGGGWTRVIAHPQRKESGSNENEDYDLVHEVRRMRDVVIADNISNANDDDNQKVKNIVLAVGPEGGWDEPYELDMFRRFNFQQITLGTRILRTDVAVVSLLSLAHDSLAAAMGNDS